MDLPPERLQRLILLDGVRHVWHLEIPVHHGEAERLAMLEHPVNGVNAVRIAVAGGVVQHELPDGRVHSKLAARPASPVEPVFFDAFDDVAVSRILRTVQLRWKDETCAGVVAILDFSHHLRVHNADARQLHLSGAREVQEEGRMRDRVAREVPDDFAAVLVDECRALLLPGIGSSAFGLACRQRVLAARDGNKLTGTSHRRQLSLAAPGVWGASDAGRRSRNRCARHAGIWAHVGSPGAHEVVNGVRDDLAAPQRLDRVRGVDLGATPWRQARLAGLELGGSGLRISMPAGRLTVGLHSVDPGWVAHLLG
mmetsp:Transcript_29576/g.80930  ORF Transcript_29576/g.80930 Transcript_29576/m.80930 type:complete len:311 (-) Transcript_29576:650-1582(-)